jgi:hypothetical protein
MISRIDSFVTSARGTITGRRNAEPGSRKTKLTQINKDGNTGHEDTSLIVKRVSWFKST